MTTRARRVAVTLLVGVLPAWLIGASVVRYMLNHFFARAPYLFDSGFLSALSYRDGVLLPYPPATCNCAAVYYDVYVSPLTSIMSVLGYVVPVGRLEWFALVQGALYVPFGLAVYLVASRFEPSSALKRLPITVVAALAFSFNGLVLWMVGYPHYEAAIPGLTCLVLGALVTGRMRTAWVCLALAVIVRQDGGFHVAFAIAPLWLVSARENRRILMLAMGLAIGTAILAMLWQRPFFNLPGARLTQAYLGDPPYAHLTIALLSDRARHFVDHGQLIYYPFLATCLIAALRRDARYLLGWAFLVPWFLFCFTAHEEVKAEFFAYGIGPFVVGVYWVYVYGAYLAPVARRPRAGVLEAAFALICVASTLGAFRSAPSMKITVADMAFARHKNRAAVHAFVDAIGDHHAELGRLRADGAIIALALEHLTYEEGWAAGVTGIDTLAFHRDSPGSGLAMLPDLVANRLDVCTHVRDTGIFACTHDRLPGDVFADTAVDVLPATFALTELPHVRAVGVDDRGLVFRSSYILSGWLGDLGPGTYEWTISLATEEPVSLSGDELARVEVIQGNTMLAFSTAPKASRQLVVRFTTDGSSQRLAYRFGSRPSSTLVITAATLRRVAPR